MGQIGATPCSAGVARLLKKKRKDENVHNKLSTDGSQDAMSLKAGLSKFRARGEELVLSTCSRRDLILWNAAADFVEAFLGGIFQHLPDSRKEVSVSCEEAAQNADALSITIRLNALLVAEFVTRTRFPHEIHLAEVVSFTVERPRKDAPGLTLVCRGVTVPPLEEVVVLRDKLEKECGCFESLSLDEVFDWWCRNKDVLCPLHESKLNRIYESIMGRFSVRSVAPKNTMKEYIRSLLCATTATVEQYHFFHGDSKVKVRMSGTRSNPPDPVARKQMLIASRYASEALKTNRALGEVFARSLTNMGALFYGESIKQPLADANAIKKLFSAASWWGPGKSGWQRFDKTWLCTDRTDSLGRVTQEQGRLIWHLQGESAPVKTYSAVDFPEKRSALACCKRRACCKRQDESSVASMLSTNSFQECN